MRKYLILITLFALCFMIRPAVYAADDDGRKIEFNTLFSFHEAGAHNPDLYIRLAELSTDPALKLAFLRQAKVLAPSKVSMLEIQRQRDLIENSQKSLGKIPWWHHILLQKYFPRYQLSYLLAFVFASSILYVLCLFRRKTYLRVPKSVFVLFLIISLLSLQHIFILPFAGDRFMVVQSRKDFSMLEGVVLESIPAYAGPSSQSHETMILSPGAEIILYHDTKADEWIQIRELGKRKGWIRLDDTVFTIKN